MRGYSKGSPRFWTGSLGRSLRGDHEAQALAWYLITGPQANLLGLYRLPLAYAAGDLGMPLERASEALQKLSERGFCLFDEELELLWVCEAARHEWGESPSPNDNQLKAVRRALQELSTFYGNSFVFNAFLDRYEDGWGEILEGLRKGFGRASEGLGKPGNREQGTGNREERQKDRSVANAPSCPADPAAPAPAARDTGGAPERVNWDAPPGELASLKRLNIPEKWRPDVVRVFEAHLEAWRRYVEPGHPRAKPPRFAHKGKGKNDCQRILEALRQGDATADELVEACRGHYLSEFHMDGNHWGIMYPLKRQNLERFRELAAVGSPKKPNGRPPIEAGTKTKDGKLMFTGQAWIPTEPETMEAKA